MVTFRMVVLPEFVCKMKEPAMPTMMSAMLTMRLMQRSLKVFLVHMGTSFLNLIFRNKNGDTLHLDDTVHPHLTSLGMLLV